MDWVPCGAPLFLVSIPLYQRGEGERKKENLLLPPPKRLITKHPLPLTINIIINRTISKDQVILVMRIEAPKRVWFGISETIAEAWDDSLLNPLSVSVERGLKISTSLWLSWLIWSAWSSWRRARLAWLVAAGSGVN